MSHHKMSGETGRLIEDEVFGGVTERETRDVSWEYFSFEESVRQVKEAQPYKDPSDPSSPENSTHQFFARDLHAVIAEEVTPDDYSRLRFYTAVGSHLDHRHSVDAFFELVDKDDKLISRVALDVTTNPHKDDYKEGVITFHFPKEGLSPKEDKEAYHEKLREVAQLVADQMPALQQA